MFQSIIVGVISGVCTATLLWLIGLVFKFHLIPWYRSQKYQGLDISGTWVASAKPTDSINGEFELFLNQHAHEISGNVTVIQTSDKNTKTLITNMNVSGTIWEGFVTLNLQSLDRKRLSYATSLLIAANGGIRLKGSYVYRSIQSDSIQTIDMIWERKE